MIFLVEGSALRLHFNRHGAAPLVWCLATDNFEIAVKGFRVYGVAIETIYRPKETPDDEDGKPSAWLAPVQISRKVVVTVNDNGWAELQHPPGETP
jgi:hypothetical protein